MNWFNFYNKEILVIGGTGSLGKAIIKKIVSSYNKYKGIRIYSRDEYKQWLTKKEFKKYDCMSFLIGDVRDEKRLKLAMKGVDIVINTAAMKQVPACEENPIEAVKTNVDGAVSIIHSAIFNNIKKVMHISTDKAVYPINLYGMTKGVAEKLFLHSNVYSPKTTKFSCCRYGNVVGSRGSVIPLFRKQFKEQKYFTVTDKRMTRFLITLDKVALFILERITEMDGDEIFIPCMPSASIIDITTAINENYKIKEIGIRPGEKLHECLITKEESEYTEMIDDYFIIRNKKTKDDIPSYYSNRNGFLSSGSIKELIKKSKIYDV